MALENILQALEAEVERQVKEINQATRVKLENIRRQAQAEADTVRQHHRAAVKTPLQAQQARILNRARLEALRLVMGAREDGLKAAMEAAASCLADLPRSGLYPELLRNLTLEAVGALGSGVTLRFHVHSRDVELMQRIIEELGLQAVVTGSLEQEGEPAYAVSEAPCGPIGGLVACTNPDERISLNNTLAARLQRAVTFHRSEIAEMLFQSEA
jgi:vacuolar-type H+-ATPase subunit E/Vma4